MPTTTAWAHDKRNSGTRNERVPTTTAWAHDKKNSVTRNERVPTTIASSRIPSHPSRSSTLVERRISYLGEERSAKTRYQGQRSRGYMVILLTQYTNLNTMNSGRSSSYSPPSKYTRNQFRHTVGPASQSGCPGLFPSTWWNSEGT